MLSTGMPLKAAAVVLGASLFAMQAQATSIGSGDYDFDEGNPADGPILGAGTVFPGMTITAAGTFAIICDTNAGAELAAFMASGSVLRVKFSGLGGVAEIFVSPVPILAALPLFAAALSGFGLVG